MIEELIMYQLFYLYLIQQALNLRGKIAGIMQLDFKQARIITVENKIKLEDCFLVGNKQLKSYAEEFYCSCYQK
ncbi:hypothetical protein pb186bvf_006026 [Paramecium bursaria]